jgi:arsenite methyltransferase
MTKRVLILCTGNSCRSQMAEALWNEVGKGQWQAFSAGSNPAGYVHPLAVRAMAELGIDLAGYRSKHLNEFEGEPFDLVVTVCDSAKESCPIFPGAKQMLHWPFVDPADAEGPEEQRLAVFREVRDHIREQITNFLTDAKHIRSNDMPSDIQREVKSKYGAVAKSGLSSEHSGVRAVAEAFGYTPQELASIPAEANMGLSCGNPTATANLKPGEVVVDLGCGGGLDVLLAAAKVGSSGKAIGIDMTEEMLELARANAAKQGVQNVEFHLATIDQLPLPDAAVDCVISNCVINLAPDKPAVFREVARVLKPGGRVAVSDIALKKPLPEELGDDLMAYVGCIAGAIFIDEYRQGLVDAGFAQVEVVDTGTDLNAYAQVENQGGCCSPAMAEMPNPGELAVMDSGCCSMPAADDALHARLLDLLTRYDVNEYAASVRVYAVKP